MENNQTIKDLLEFYYKGFAEKSNWESVIADDFEYVGGNMTEKKPLIGKNAYVEVIQRFSKAFTAMRVQKMIIQDNTACVIGNYDLTFLNGKEINGNVAELWTAKKGKLQSLTIFFDTLTFYNNTKK